MATPRLIAGLLTAPYDGDLRRVIKGNPIEGQRLAQAAADYLDALAWDDEANAAADLATLDYLLAQSLGFDSEGGHAYLERALAAARRAVAGNPAQPYTWVQMSIALERLEGVSSRSVGALVESMRRARYQPRLALLRSSLALRAWTLLDTEGRALAAEQLLLAAELNPKALAAAVPSPSLWRVVQDILVAQPALLQAVEAARQGS